MWGALLEGLDRRRWPQRLVRWVLSRKRCRSTHARGLPPLSEGTHAVALTVSTPLVASHDLFEHVVPKGFGSWHEVRVRATATYGNTAVAVVEEPLRRFEFALVVPMHAGFSRWRFRRAKHLRLSCEAERSSLMTVRDETDYLLAAGTLERQPVAAWSWELRT